MRDDALALYGFHSEQERDLFLMLLSVQAVGPKVALAVLSGGTPRELISRARGGRRRPLPGGAGHRQAHGRADHRRAAREGGRGERRRRRGATPIIARRGEAQASAALARDGLLELGYAPAEAEELLRDAGGRQRRGADRRQRCAWRARRVSADDRDRPASRRPYLVAEDELDRSLRPRRLEEFVGQETLREQLAVAIEAASARGDALDHLLLAGPPGLGKTSLAQIVAAELDVPFVQTAGPALERKGDIAAFLTALEPRSVFFVDEIHRLPRTLEETFYPAMEDHRLPITVGQGAGARVVTLELPPFTLVGATTRTGLLTTPLRDRFGIQARLEPYARGRAARSSCAARRASSRSSSRTTARVAIAARSRGTPRVANRLLKRVRDFAEVRMEGVVDGRGRAGGARDARGRRARAGSPGPRDPERDLREVRRRPGRPLDAGGRGRRGAGHDRGRV